MVWFQDSILKCLHHHTLSNMLFDIIPKAHYAQNLSCSDLGAGVLLMVKLIFLTFQLSFPIFFTMFWTWFGLPHLTITGLFQCVYTHPIDPRVSTSYITPMVKNTWNSWCSSWHLCFHFTKCKLSSGMRTTTCASFSHVQFLLSMSWHYAHQRLHSHLNWCCYC